MRTDYRSGENTEWPELTTASKLLIPGTAKKSRRYVPATLTHSRTEDELPAPDNLAQRRRGVPDETAQVQPLDGLQSTKLTVSQILHITHSSINTEKNGKKTD